MYREPSSPALKCLASLIEAETTAAGFAMGEPTLAKAVQDFRGDAFAIIIDGQDDFSTLGNEAEHDLARARATVTFEQPPVRSAHTLAQPVDGSHGTDERLLLPRRFDVSQVDSE